MRNKNSSELPAHTLLMVKHGLLNPRASSCTAFGLWMRLCEDNIVRERSQKYSARKRADYLPSVMAGYSYAAKVLNAMTAKERQALRQRLGVKPEKEFSVL
jgi:hypothetical protein